ncbi:O-antigen ligase family protein [Neobacillus rhizophilus]|uniref:O-antigen ligase family protein n=1 Tax=Neobacillus rhizophilus TaxID=2833579 RepID=A0A942U5A1_9BACI|nr:O-antigen ligase family protein [Neobacillus rhizophilus]MBS4212687.1 O-antigen ligase family protein [Neobacillus rhizophilus]
MWKMILILFSISLGTIYTVRIGGSGYNLQIAEVLLFFLFFIFMARSYDSGIKIQVNLFEKIFLVLQIICGTYAILIFLWSDYGISVFPGALSIFIGFIAFLFAKVLLKESVIAYEIANRFLLSSIVLQLVLNMGLNLNTIDNQFYALKVASVTLMGESNYISIFLGFFFLYEFISRKKYWILFVLISILGIFLTVSRGAILSISFSLIVYIIITLFNSKVNKFKTILSILFVIFIALFLFNKTIVGVQLLTQLTYGFETGNSAGRDVLLHNAILQFLSNPFGSGIVLDNDPHNVIIKSLRDLGIIFGPIYITLLLYPLYYLFNYKVIRYSNTTIALLVGYFSVIIHSLVEIFYFNSSSIIWTVCTLAAINNMVSLEKKKRFPVDSIY